MRPRNASRSGSWFARKASRLRLRKKHGRRPLRYFTFPPGRADVAAATIASRMRSARKSRSWGSKPTRCEGFGPGLVEIAGPDVCVQHDHIGVLGSLAGSKTGEN